MIKYDFFALKMRVVFGIDCVRHFVTIFGVRYNPRVALVYAGSLTSAPKYSTLSCILKPLSARI